MSAQRLLRELADFKKNKIDGINVEMVNDNNQDLIGYINGSPETPYESGVFQIEIKIPDSYPFYPPKMRFITRVWHPNVSSQTGYICLDILSRKWAAAMTIRVVLISLQAMLSDPNPSDPQDAVVAGQMLSDRDLFERTAQYWTYYYANGSFCDAMLKDSHQYLISMGFNGDCCLQGLSTFNWGVDRTVQFLLKD